MSVNTSAVHLYTRCEKSLLYIIIAIYMHCAHAQKRGRALFLGVCVRLPGPQYKLKHHSLGQLGLARVL